MKDTRTERPVSPGVAASRGADPDHSWSPATRVLFRFSLVYLGLFMLATQVVGSLAPGVGFRGFGTLWPMREITSFVATGLLGLARPEVPVGVSGETVFFWVQTLWLLFFASVVSLVWSRLDRDRAHYQRPHQWFRLFVRIGLAAQMFEYGMTKIIPTQFPSPSLTTLLTPVGDLSLSASLWATIGASPAYAIFTGCAELVAGILLLFPSTTLLGAVICLANMIHVLALNMTFDIGLKLTTFHLVLLCGFLLAPDLKRLAQLFVLDRPTAPSARLPLFSTARANRIGFVAPVLLGVGLVGAQTYLNTAYWYAVGGGAPRSVLYGIWDVEELRVDGEIGPAVLNDYDRQWRRVVFDSPGEVAFQRFDDSFARYGAVIDLASSRIRLTKGESRNWNAVFAFERPSPDDLVLEGEMDGYQIGLRLGRVEFDTFRLLNSHFRWTQPNGG